MRLLVTGAAGFIGTNLVRHALGKEGVRRLVAVDLLTYAGNYANLADLETDPRFRFVRADIADREAMAALVDEEAIDKLVNCAAETHVDRSIADHWPFVTTNVDGTLVLLEAVRGRPSFRRFLQVSTDEVYGSIAAGRAATLVRYVADRPGHDRRYALDAGRLRQSGWQPWRGFEEGLAATVAWYREHRSWWEAIKSGAYREYYEDMYGGRLRDSSAVPRP